MIKAFIPARGGSEGVPKKNIRILGDKPLILHTIEFAQKSYLFDEIIVSTDSAEIAAVASKNEIKLDDFENLQTDSILGLENNFKLHKRKKSQAQTLSPIRDTLFEISADNHELSKFDYLCMLQPTSPFRTKEDIVSIEKHLADSENWSSIASFTKVGGMHPDRMWRMTQNSIMSPFLSQLSGDNKPRQLLEELYIKDGAYYLLKSDLLKREVMLGDNVRPIIRDGIYTVNIDTELDFLIAELIYEKYF